MVRVVLSAIAAKQKTWLACGFGILDGCAGLVVLRMPCLFMRMRPLAVAVEGCECVLLFTSEVADGHFCSILVGNLSMTYKTKCIIVKTVQLKYVK